MKIKHNRIVRYMVVGGSAYLIEMIILYGLHDVFRLSSVYAVTGSFWAGFVVAFILQKIVTFQNYDRRMHLLTVQLMGYSLLVVWNYAITLLAVRIFENHASVFIIRTVVIVFVTVWNFAIYRYLFHTQTNNSLMHEKRN